MKRSYQHWKAMSKNKVALITGITGQDGYYLAKLLLEKDYIVHGTVRRSSNINTDRIDPLISEYSSDEKLNLHYSDLLDSSSLSSLVNLIQPDEIYNLAAQSHVNVSFKNPIFTTQVGTLGALSIMEAIRYSDKKIKFYQASSSEMFGRSVDKDGYQRETTPFQPTSPYGCSKVFAFNMVKHYRIAYKLFASNGILFNHESPRRGSNFVTNKVVKTAVRIKLGLENKLILGNIYAFRDWGHSKDYVEAMRLILNYKKADDWVVATGQTRSVKQMTDYVFKKLKLNTKKHVSIDKKYFRPEELKYLRGDCTKVKKYLKWKPKYKFEEMLDEMIDFWMDYFQKN